MLSDINGQRQHLIIKEIVSTISVRLEDEVLKTSYFSVFFQQGRFSIPITRFSFLFGKLDFIGLPVIFVFCNFWLHLVTLF